MKNEKEKKSSTSYDFYSFKLITHILNDALNIALMMTSIDNYRKNKMNKKRLSVKEIIYYKIKIILPKL